MSENQINKSAIGGGMIGRSSIETQQPTPDLRFVEREGKRILQQCWAINGNGYGSLEWRDVPLGVE